MPPDDLVCGDGAPDLGVLASGGLVARVFGTGAVALALGDTALTTGSRLDLRDEATGARWTFGPEMDGDAQVQHVLGLVGVRIVRAGIDARLALGLPPGGTALVVRLDVTNRSDVPRALSVASSVRLAGGAWETVAALDARTAEAAPGRCLAHTLVPDDGRGSDEGHASPGDAEAGIRRTTMLAPGETQGWTVCVGVGPSVRAALGAAFPHLSGQRSRAALREAREASPPEHAEG